MAPIADEMKIFLFGDQTGDARSSLQRTLRRKGNMVLSSFLERVTVALRQEIARQPQSLMNEHLSSFTALSELAERYYESKRPSAILDGMLSCISQLAEYSCYLEESASGLIGSSNTRIMGLCTGLLAASAVACSQTLADFVTLAVEVVRVALRAGVLVESVSRRLIPLRGSSEDDVASNEVWSRVAADLNDVEAISALKEFHRSKGIPSSNQAYLSSVGISTVTISGPPATLDSVVADSEYFRQSRCMALPVQGLYHAPHLYTQDDVRELLRDMPALSAFDQPPRLPILSSVTGETLTARSAKDLIEQVVTEYLRGPLHWDRLVQAMMADVVASKVRTCHVIPFGPGTASGSLSSALRSETQVQTNLKDPIACEPRPTNVSVPLGSLRDSKIAIVGMAGRFPDAPGLEPLWKLLEEGLDVHRRIPPDRFDVEAHYDSTGKRDNTSHTPYGCFIPSPGLFDPRFFNMSPREAAQTDPMQRLALVTAYEALEMAGFVPNRTPSTRLDRVGTFYGQTSDDWREINAAQKVDTYFIPGGVRAFAPGRINYFFKFSGPSFSIDTACSSSFAAIQLACTSLWAGDCDTAVTGGLNVLTNPDIFAGLSRGQFLSKTGSCKTFDNSADGYCRADGIGSVVLKRLEDAELDRDNILGLILGTATNHSADAVSITHPHAGAQANLARKILSSAGVDPLDVSYVEMHGTGTQAGDGMEMRSVTDVFAPAQLKRKANNPLHLGAVKSSVGHGEAAAGVTSLIKVLLMLQHNAIPRHVGIKDTINVGFPKDLRERNVRIPLETVPWLSTSGRQRMAFLNNFSAAGGNTALLLEDGSRHSRTIGRDPRSTHVITISAKSELSLQKNVERLASLIEEDPAISLASLAYTTTARRQHHNYRLAFAVSDLSAVRDALRSSLMTSQTPIATSPPKVAFLFTGQGSQYAALGRRLYEESKFFRCEILNLEKLSQGQGFPSLLPLVDGSVTDLGTFSPVVVQLGMICVQMALARLWMSWGITPCAVLGHSLGEYAALNAAGVLSASDTIHLVGHRARALETRCTTGTHAMLAVKASVSTISDALAGQSFEIACINGPEDTVLGGTTESIDSLATDLHAQGLKSTKLQVPFAFHSTQVEPILDEFERQASVAVYSKPNIPVVSPLLGDVVQGNGIINAGYLRRHAREPVNFLDAIKAAEREGIINTRSVFIEVGPHPVCSTMVKSALGAAVTTAPSLRRNEDAWKTIANSLCTLYCAAVPVGWSEYHRDFNSAHCLLRLPSYYFDEKNHWLQYTGNWTLTKGTVAEQPKAIAPAKPALSTSSVHRIVQEDIQSETITVVTESDITHPALQAAVTGHLVNGAGLCPSSIYADMALTIANYLYEKARPGKESPGMSVCEMEVFKPLIAKTGMDAGSQIIQVKAIRGSSLDRVELRYSSVDPGNNNARVDHAKCFVEYGDRNSWLTAWSRSVYLIQPRMHMLQDGVAEGRTHCIRRGLAYKLFSALVQYDAKYRGMEEVILDSAQFEAMSRVAFQTSPSDGDFFCSPYWIDSLAHISGFIVNGTDAVDSKNEVYVSHGWKSLRFGRPLSPDGRYRSYVRMQPDKGKMMVGDVYVFEDDTMMGLVEGLKFQCIPRAVLDSLLPPTGLSSQSKTQAPVPKRAKEPQDTFSEPRSTETVMSAPAKAHIDTVKDRVLQLVADEVGVQLSELVDDAEFAALGVDSLMTLAITGKMREELELDDVPSSLFTAYPTVRELKHFLLQYSPEDDSDRSSENPEAEEPGLSPESQSASPPSSYIHTPVGEEDEDPVHMWPEENHEIEPVTPSAVEKRLEKDVSYPPATSILLQGSPKTASKMLFLFPDGSGSATSYVAIPKISPDVCLYGLNCPFMRNPKEYTCGIEVVSKLYLDEVRRRQPRGPYHIGGWSAGGIVAYEVTRQLLLAGENVERLVLLDSPCPIDLPPLPSKLHQFLDSIGLLGTGNPNGTPGWLLPHFTSSIANLTAYKPKTIDKSKAPQTFAIWARHGVCPNPEDPRPPISPEDPPNMRWLLDNRTDFGLNGWDKLLAPDKFTTTSMPGNHFTMMREPFVDQLGGFIRRALA